MSRIILRTKHNGVFTGTLKPSETSGDRDGVTVELDSVTGLALWCPAAQIQEIISLPVENDFETKRNSTD